MPRIDTSEVKGVVKKQILIVDDEQLILLGLKEALKTESVHISTAATAAKAMVKVANSQYDLYILDLTLPDMDGFELAKNIKSHDPNAKFIFMSGKYCGLEDMLQNSQEATEIGPRDFITKPFDFGQAQESVFHALES
jgi:DNA-binding NtrC family response regulator